jgi:hypothetical protein
MGRLYQEAQEAVVVEVSHNFSLELELAFLLELVLVSSLSQI